MGETPRDVFMAVKSFVGFPLLGLDIVELNPSEDIENRTGMLASALLLNILAQYGGSDGHADFSR